ncbi:MAG TPA: hypothetical protein VJ873_02560 [bacterium]|nr:hypothetical protein [bacterium]
MKSKTLSTLALSLLLVLAAVPVRSDDSRIIGKLDHSGPTDPQSTASLYLALQGNQAEGLPALPYGTETRFCMKVWDGLYLQAFTQTDDNGIRGYLFAFSKDEAGQKLLAADETPFAPSLRQVSAADFRTSENFTARPLKWGPGTMDDRNALREVHYPGFDAEIRVLEFNIGDAQFGKRPFFKNMSCLVTVKEHAQLAMAPLIDPPEVPLKAPEMKNPKGGSALEVKTTPPMKVAKAKVKKKKGKKHSRKSSKHHHKPRNETVFHPVPQRQAPSVVPAVLETSWHVPETLSADCP